LPTNKIVSIFLKNYENLTQVLSDRKLAALGDAYINLAYSIALSNKTGNPCGKKVKGTPLAEALRKAGLRAYLPSRMDKHDLTDGAEALLAYTWLNNLTTLEEDFNTLIQAETLEDGLVQLLLNGKEKIKLSKLCPVPY
jgi:hypothetical protein